MSYRIIIHWFKIDLQGKYIVISGCDTGFGRKLAETLLEKNVNVIACCYQKNSLMELKNQFKNTKFYHHCFPVQLDISNYESCENAATFVENLLKIKNEKLYALVNNAGVTFFFIFFFQIPEMNTCGWNHVNARTVKNIDVINQNARHVIPLK